MKLMEFLNKNNARAKNEARAIFELAFPIWKFTSLF